MLHHWKTLLVGTAVLTALASTPAIAAPTPTTAPASSATAPAAGDWHPMTQAQLSAFADTSELKTTVETNNLAVTPNTTGPVPTAGCPKGSATSGQYACVAVFNDQSGHGVFLREGKKDPGGFGFQHTYYDHNLFDNAIARTIADNSIGQYNKNTKRYVYGAYYSSKEQPHLPLENIIISEQREAGGGDKYELGIVTGFCADAGGDAQSKCPGWVNEEL